MLPDHLSAGSRLYTQKDSSHMNHSGRDELLEPFLQALGSRKALEIPQETILGAITHFLSTLPLADLPRFITATLDSEHLWASDGYAGGQLNQAIALAVSGKVANLEKRHQSTWFASRKISSSSRRWLDTIQTVLESSEARSMTILQFRVGLLSGISSKDDVTWGEARVNLEEQVVLGVSELGLSAADQRRLAIVCEVVHHIDPSRLRILDLQAIVPFIQNALVASLDQTPSVPVRSSTLAVALGKIFEVLSEGNKQDKALLWASVDRFVEIMGGRAKASEEQRGNVSKMSDEKWNKHKTALFAFLVPCSKIIDILLSDTEHDTTENQQSSADLCVTIIATLSAFSFITQQSEGGLEGHDRVLFGALDILVAKEGSQGVKRLFKTLILDGMSESRAAFVLRCGELVVNDMDSSSLVQDLLPLSQSNLRRPDVKAAFDAAHTFMAAIITSTGQSEIRPLPQAAFAAEIAPYYSRLLIQQFLHGDITTDQFRSALPPAIGLAAKCDESLALDCIIHLESTITHPEHKHTAMLARISIAQYVPTTKLRPYLDRLADDIVNTPAGDERLELAANAFGMVVRELGDQQKRIGIDWWLERKAQIEGKDRSMPTHPIRAKL